MKNSTNQQKVKEAFKTYMSENYKTQALADKEIQLISQFADKLNEAKYLRTLIIQSLTL